MVNTSAMKQFRCVLISGASAGLGEEFARQLAARCQSIVLVARRVDRLNEIAESLRAQQGIEVHCIACDLTKAEDRVTLFSTMSANGLFPDGLINNAGMGDYGAFHDADWQKISAMMQLNMEALTHLCHLFLPSMIRQGRGEIINISSMASILPIPDFAVYAATKAYVSSFSEALKIELREFGINVTAVCPGPVHTEFGQVAARREGTEIHGMREWFYVSKAQVVTEAIRGMDRDAARVYPGWKIALAAAGISLLPLAALRLIMSSRPRKVQG